MCLLVLLLSFSEYLSQLSHRLHSRIISLPHKQTPQKEEKICNTSQSTHRLQHVAVVSLHVLRSNPAAHRLPFTPPPHSYHTDQPPIVRHALVQLHHAPVLLQRPFSTHAPLSPPLPHPLLLTHHLLPLRLALRLVARPHVRCYALPVAVIHHRGIQPLHLVRLPSTHLRLTRPPRLYRRRPHQHAAVVLSTLRLRAVRAQLYRSTTSLAATSRDQLPVPLVVLGHQLAQLHVLILRPDAPRSRRAAPSPPSVLLNALFVLVHVRIHAPRSLLRRRRGPHALPFAAHLRGGCGKTRRSPGSGLPSMEERFEHGISFRVEGHVIFVQ